MIQTSYGDEPSSTAAPCVLIVDDNPSIRTMLEMQVRRSGYRPLAVKDGEEALTAAQRGDIGLILMDYSLSGMSGSDVVSRLRALEGEAADIPIIGISANPDFFRTRCEAAARVDVNIDKALLHQSLPALLERYIGANELDVDELGRRREILGAKKMRQIVSAFLKEGNDHIAAMDAALARGDYGEAVEIAHRLKGSAAVFQMRRLHAVLGELEDALQGDGVIPDHARSRFDGVARGWRRAGRCYARWLAAAGAAQDDGDVRF